MYKAYDKAAIQSVIDEFRLSDIQSESEVRSKFIVRLSEVLGYSSQFRGEEFPVYGYGGREPLRAKDADFIFLMINRLAVTERIPRRIRHGLENIAFWLLRLRNRVRCQKIWDKLSSIQCGQRQ